MLFTTLWVSLMVRFCTWLLYRKLLIIPGYTDSLKCIAWKGRALVIGFAAGTIEKVSNALCTSSFDPAAYPSIYRSP